MAAFGELESDVQEVLAVLRTSGRKPFEDLGVEGARAAYRAGRFTTQLESIPIESVEDIELGGGLAARIYRPQGASAACILFFHGGGWVIGDLDTHDSICRRLAVASERTLIAVDYRLAPEHFFPAALDDALQAWWQIIKRADALRIDPTDIVLAGDSAGGTLAAVVAQTAMLEAPPHPVAQLLFYPVTDLRGETDSYRRVKGVPITAATMHWFRDQYLAHPQDAADWRASPLLTSRPGSFPATFITTAGHDPLCDEGVQFARMLHDAGVPVKQRHLAGQIHGYLTLGKFIGEAGFSLDAAGAFLKGLGA